MFRDKRQGVEITVNTIIIFALAILILLILAFIIMGGFKNWSKGTDCRNQGGQCVPIGGGYSCPENLPVTSAYTCDIKDTRCCTAVGGLGGAQ